LLRLSARTEGRHRFAHSLHASRERGACPYRKLTPGILVVQSS
jgi:hypothetical protein